MQHCFCALGFADISHEYFTVRTTKCIKCHHVPVFSNISALTDYFFMKSSIS